MQNSFKHLGVHIPEILLPAEGTDLTKWAVIACDQYTSQPDYWEKVNGVVGESPSTLKLTFPEIYLKDDDKEKRIACINQTMSEYVDNRTLEPQKPGFILVDRSTPHAASRKGLILALDLECYDYRPGSKALIRATEGTVLDRIPPRVKIRENAPIELPHIMVLIDDPGRTLVEALFDRTESYEKLYDFDLMQNGGHIRGWKVEDEDSLNLVADALEKLAGAGQSCKDAEDSTSGSASSPLLFAVGDGNHSLASAKAHWENVKAVLTNISDHPARYALVEIVNVHDEGLAFEPIHRVLFGIDSKTVLESITAICSRITNGKSTAGYRMFQSRNEMEAALTETRNAGKDPSSTGSAAAKQAQDIHLVPFVVEGCFGLLSVSNPANCLEVGTLQAILDELAKNAPGMEIDYIHGEQVVTELGSKSGSMGFYLPVMDKHDLFRTVNSDGVLPRKTFSMGEAEEKRYYLECRRIR